MSRVFGVLCVLVVGVSGCFAPDLSMADLLCDGEMRGCPPGYSCVEGHCREVAEETPDLMLSGDAGTVADLSPKASGCRDGNGTDVSWNSSVFACPGPFAASPDPNKSAGRLCAQSFKLCVSAAAVQSAVCNALDGFFMAEVPARASLPNASCGAARAGESPGLAGCGKAGSGVYAVPSCAGFGRAIFAGGPNGIAIVAPYNLDPSATNLSNSNGVLCCK